MTEQLEEKDLAYIAGIFDGEGYVGADQGGGGYLHVKISNQHRGILAACQGVWGGSLRQTSETGSRVLRRPVWDWSLTTAKAVPFLRAVLPYLVIKHTQAALGIQLGIRPDMRSMTPEEKAEEHELRSWIGTKLKELKCR